MRMFLRPGESQTDVTDDDSIPWDPRDDYDPEDIPGSRFDEDCEDIPM